MPAAAAESAHAAGASPRSDSTQQDHDALLNAARRGDRAALTRVYEMFAPMVHGILLARVPRGETDDLVQDVFLHAMRKLRTVREAAALGSWLASIARNVATDFLRRRPLAASIPDEMPLSAPGRSNSGDLEEAQRALSAIRSLPPAYHETLILRLVEGLSGPEIATRTGLTPGSVRINLHRGMQMLLTKLGLENQS